MSNDYLKFPDKINEKKNVHQDITHAEANICITGIVISSMFI